MKITIKKTLFQRMLSRVQGFTEKRVTLPILSHILIETYDESVTGKKGIKIKATDLHISIQMKTECTVMEEGACALSAKGLSDMIRELPDADLFMQTEENTRVKITVGNYMFNLNIMDPEEYPMIEFSDLSLSAKGGDKDVFSIDPLVLKSMIDRTIFSIPTPSEEESKYALGGALLVSHTDEKEKSASGGKANYIEMVTTDGRRLSLARHKIQEAIDMKDGIIIPRKGLHELKRLIDTTPVVSAIDDGTDKSLSAKGGAEILLTRDSIYFKSSDTIATVRLIDGEFPDYSSVIDLEEYPIYTKIYAPKLLSALKVCSTIVSEVSNSAKFDFKRDTTVVYANNPEQGDVEIPIESEHHGDAIGVSFNPRYLIECLSMIDGDAIIRLVNEEGPCLIMACPPETDFDSPPEAEWVIMPMRF